MSLYIKKTKHGRGVFSTEPFSEGDIIEVCPVIPLSLKHGRIVQTTFLEDYVFQWPGGKQTQKTNPEKWSSCCVCLGYGSLYNHSFTPNCDWEARVKKLEMVFVALKDIPANTELVHDYEWPEWKAKEVGVTK